MTIDSRHTISCDNLSHHGRGTLRGHCIVADIIRLLIRLQLVLLPLLMAVFVFVPPRPVAVPMFPSMSVFVFMFFVFPLLPRLSLHCRPFGRSTIGICSGG